MAKLEIVKDSEGNKIVLIPEILFFNKQNIEWELVEQYLEKYVGEIVEIAETKRIFENTMHPNSKALLSAVPKVKPTENVERITLKGDVPSPINPGKECRFAKRCWMAREC